MKTASLGTKLLYVGFSIASLILLILIGYNISLHTNNATDLSVLAQNGEDLLGSSPTPIPQENEINLSEE